MKPYFFGVQSYYLMWLVAAIVGVWTGMELSRRAGFPRLRSFLALLVLTFCIFLGSKLLYVVEYLFFPLDDPLPAGQESLGMLLWHGFRIPGGILLLAPTLPVVCRALGLPTVRFADATFPAVGVAVFFIRIGCFLNGCCFGAITSGPLSMRFPSEARVWQWQVTQGYVPVTSAYSLPVHPLQVYFALLGLLLLVLGLRWQETKRFEGQVWVNFYLVFFAGTFLLEFLRATPLHLNFIMAATVVLVTAWLGARARQARPVVAGVAS